jgi:hypothetical protein
MSDPVSSNQIYKYPRTRHIEGSRLQPGDEDLDSVPFSKIAGRHLVVEEKVDGANCGISFGSDGELLLQSRGHYLTGGHREKHFTLFKQWATTHASSLWRCLRHRYVLYGEWLYAKHTVYYDRLPHYFMEFDILDTVDTVFLNTNRRQKLLQDVAVVPVRILHAGPLTTRRQLTDLVGPSAFMTSSHLTTLRSKSQELGLDTDRTLRETDQSDLMEGLYIKVEEDGIVSERYKYVRADFLTAVFQAEGHWLNRQIIPNQLDQSVDLFEAGS